MRARLARVSWCALSALLLLPGPGLANDRLSSRRRAEARGQLELVLSGRNLRAAVSRIEYLGQQRYAAIELAKVLPQTVEVSARRDIVLALSILGRRESEAALLEALEDEDGAVRMLALTGLARMKSARADRLLPLLKDPTSGARREAARALGTTRSKLAAPALLARARTEDDPEARAAMLLAIGELKHRSLAPALKAFTTHASETTRLAAARSLCLLGDPAGFELARRMLASPERLTRRQGLGLLEGLTLARVTGLARPLLDDPDRALAAAAGRLLYQAGDKKMLRWLVLSATQATPEDRVHFETELEPMRLTDEARAALLTGAPD